MAQLDKRIFDVVFAEAAGGNDEEIAATASVFLNRIDEQGIEKALRGSTAFRKKSKQFVKASTGDLNAFERKEFRRIMRITSEVSNPQNRLPFDFMENVTTFGDPPFLRDMASSRDIGRQRFFVSKNRMTDILTKESNNAR